MNNLLLRIPDKYWAYLALSFWGTLCFIVLNKIPYGIDEGAARALLLVWSIVDNVASPIVTSGLPDFRTVFFVPAGILWTGNVLAAKISTIVVMSGAIWAIHRWRQCSGNGESSLLASGLLLISPLLLDQIDSISVAPYLLITFALGAWSDKIYRDSPIAFGGRYFSQMFLCMISTSLHPAGLAYPLALLWSWYRNPVERQQKYFFGGVVFSVLFSLLLTLGWHHFDWLTNPFDSLSSLLSGSLDRNDKGAFRWITGLTISALLLLVIWKQAGNIWSDFLGRTMLIALVIGTVAGDKTWSIIALTICLYWGFPLLLRTRMNSSDGFWGQRGITLLLLFVVSTSFMLVDKARYEKALSGELTPRENLLRSLVENTDIFSNNDARQYALTNKPILIASQWPGLTMLACRCGAFPLPPPAKDEQELLAMLRGVNYLIFDPRDPKNSSLSHNLAIMNGGRVKTIDLQEGGVIVEIKGTANSEVK